MARILANFEAVDKGYGPGVPLDRTRVVGRSVNAWSTLIVPLTRRVPPDTGRITRVAGCGSPKSGSATTLTRHPEVRAARLRPRRAVGAVGEVSVSERRRLQLLWRSWTGPTCRRFTSRPKTYRHLTATEDPIDGWIGTLARGLAGPVPRQAGLRPRGRAVGDGRCATCRAASTSTSTSVAPPPICQPRNRVTPELQPNGSRIAPVPDAATMRAARTSWKVACTGS